jgi:hypothetical protein
MTIKTTAASAVLAVAMASSVMAGNIPSKAAAPISGNIPSVAKTDNSKDILGNIPSKVTLADVVLALVNALI